MCEAQIIRGSTTKGRPSRLEERDKTTQVLCGFLLREGCGLRRWALGKGKKKEKSSNDRKEQVPYLGLDCHLPISNTAHLWESRDLGSEDS